MSKSSRHICFTTYITDRPPVYREDEMRYIIYQQERCPSSGRHHWQGYVEFKRKITFNTMKEIFNDNTIHLEMRQGTRDEAREYCRKSNTQIIPAVEFGTWSAGGQGSRNDLRKIAQLAIKHDDIYLLDNHPEILYKYEKWISKVRSIEDMRKASIYVNKFYNCSLNKQQKEWDEYLDNQNERQILWIHDSQGGTGKTFFSKHLIAKKNAIRFTNGRTADISAAYNYNPIVVFDFARSCEDRINYQIIEDLKNGMLFDSKYKSKCKYFTPPKVVIMANFMPHTEKLSKDRWVILNPAVETQSL